MTFSKKIVLLAVVSALSATSVSFAQEVNFVMASSNTESVTSSVKDTNTPTLNLVEAKKESGSEQYKQEKQKQNKEVVKKQNHIEAKKKIAPIKKASKTAGKVIELDEDFEFRLVDKTKKVIKLEEPALKTARDIAISAQYWNVFKFNVPVKNILIDEDAPLTYKSLNENQTIMLRTSEKSAGSRIEIGFEMADGSLNRYFLVPNKNMVEGVSKDIMSEKSAFSSRIKNDSIASANEQVTKSDIDLLSKLIESTQSRPWKMLDGFEKVALPAAAKFDKYTAIPRMKATDGSRNVLIFKLIGEAGKSAVISPRDFYKPGVLAASVEGDLVSEDENPLVFIVEQNEDSVVN